MFKADHKTRRGNEMMITTEQDFQQIYDSERASMSKNFTFFLLLILLCIGTK